MEEYITILSRLSVDAPWKVVSHTKMRVHAFAAYWASRRDHGADCTKMLRRQGKSRDEAIKACRAGNRIDEAVSADEAFDASEFAVELPSVPVVASVAAIAPPYAEERRPPGEAGAQRLPEHLRDVSKLAHPDTQTGQMQHALRARLIAQGYVE